MRFLTPYALSLLPLVVIPFFLSRLRPQRTAVASTFLWRESDVEQSASRWSRRRRHWRAVIQAAVILATVAALARPELEWRSRHVALVLDMSASMDARDGRGTRADSARVRAADVLAGLSKDARVRLIAAKRTPVVIGEFPAGAPALRTMMAGLRPSGGPADLAEAVRLARSSGDASVVVISDAAPSSDVDLQRTQWIQVGTPVDNVAITALAVRRLPSTPDNAQALIEVSNYGAAERSVPLDVDEDQHPILHETVLLKPHASVSIVRDVTHVGRVLTATIAANDALALDDRRAVVVDALRPVRVRTLSSSGFFLGRALAANPRLAIEPSGSGRPSGDADADVVICEGCPTIPAVAAGIVLVAAAAADHAAPVPLTISEPSHPIAQGLELAGSTGVMSSGPALPAGTFDVVARAGSRPAIVAGTQDGRRIVVINLDLQASRFPLTTAFPVLMANAIEWAAAMDDAPLNIASGDVLRWRSHAPQASYDVIAPGGTRVPARRIGDLIVAADTDVPGVYQVREHGVDHQVAVNTATDTESDLNTAAAPHALAALSDNAQHSSELAPYLLAAALLLFAADWYLSGSGADRFTIVWRIGAATALALAAAGVKLPTPGGPAAVIYAIDQSDSISVRARQRSLESVNRAIGAMRRSDLAGVVTFGADAALERRPRAPAPVAATGSAIPTSGTNIERALRIARGALPNDGDRRIVLVSDGVETAGHAAVEAARAAAEGIRIDVVPTDQMDGRPRGTRVRRVDVPEEVRLGEAFDVAVEIEGPPRTSTRVVLEAGGRDRAVQRVDIPSEGVAVASFVQIAGGLGVRSFRAATVDADGAPGPSWAGGSTTVSGRPAVLYVGPTTDDPLRRDLATGGFSVSIARATELPATSGALAAFDAIVLDDVASDEMTSGQATALSQYVTQAGGGLLLLGSARTLEAGGYPQTPIGPLLPVDLRPRAGRRAPPVAFVVLFDKSGSMADRVDGIQKIELARQAVLKMVDVVPPGDAVGVVSFDAKPAVVAPLGVRENPAALADRLRAIEANGSTAIAPAVDVAEEWLRHSPYPRRHVLLLSDGRTSAADAERLRAIARSKPFELSVVAIGPDADRDFLRAIAEQTGGRAYFPDELRQLPRILARDAARAAGGTVVEEMFSVSGAEGHPILAGIDRTRLPRLGGYVVAAPKPGADSILTSHLEDPVLAGWRVGLGRVGVFTADAHAAWSAPLWKWSGHAQLWIQTLRWIARQTANPLLHATITPLEDGARLDVEAERPDGTFARLASPRVIVRSPEEGTQTIALRPTAPGAYAARIATDREGAYELAVSATDERTGQDLSLVKGFFWTNEREQTAPRSNAALLSDLAATTGGRMLVDANDRLDDRRSFGKVDVAPALEIAGLAIFVTGLAWNRRWRIKRFNPAAAPIHGQPVPRQRAS